MADRLQGGIKMNRIKKLMIFMYSLQDGGAQRTIVNVINNIDKSRFEVVLVLGTSNNNIYLEDVNKNIRIVYLECKKLRFTLIKLTSTIKKEKPDVLFTTLNKNNIALLLAKTLSFENIPVIIRETNNRTQSGNVSKINKIITRLTYNYLSKKIIALSVGVKEDLMTNFKVNQEKIEVIYNPVEVNKITKQTLEKVEDVEINAGEKLLVSVGRLVEQKDYSTLLYAFNKVANSVESRLLILGRGPLEKRLKELSEELNISNKVVFLGYKRNPYKYMKMADLFVLSSKHEGFGHVIVEAMASGTSVISTDCKSGPGEIIEDNKYGVLVPVGNIDILAEKIIELLENDDLRKYYEKRGYERAKSFQANLITKEYEFIFDNV